MNSVLDQIRHRMLVSCQGYDERTFHTAEDMLAMANAAYLGGCAGFRFPGKVKLDPYPAFAAWSSRSRSQGKH